MANKIIRDMARENGVHLWEIAERFGMNDGNFSRKLRRPLSDEETERALQFIEEIAARKESGNHAGD